MTVVKLHRPARPLALLLEDQPSTRQWLVGVLKKAFPGVEVVTAGTLREGFAALQRLEDEEERSRLVVALLDIGVPDGSGIDLVREVADRWPDALPIVATIYDDDEHLFEAIGAGARGYLLKSEEPEVLVGYLHRIQAGEPPLSPSIAHRILTHFRSQAVSGAARPLPHQSTLTARETEVLTLLGRGLTVAETAERLGLSAQTVAGYVKTIYSKLSISNRAEAALEARRRGLV